MDDHIFMASQSLNFLIIIILKFFMKACINIKLLAWTKVRPNREVTSAPLTSPVAETP